MMDIEFSAIQIEYVFNEENAIYSMIPRVNFIVHFTFCLMLFLTVIIGESNFLSSSNLWTVWKINLAIMQVGVPVLTVLKENQLRHYSYHFLRSKFEGLFFYQI